MKRLFILLAFLPLPLLGVLPQEDEDEALFVRRIYALWQDKDYLFAQREIEDFTLHFPQSPYLPRFTAILGDIAFHEKKYEEALQHYEKVSDPQIKQTVATKKWHAKYLLKQFDEIIVEITEDQMAKNEEARFIYAESCFRKGCLLSATDSKEATRLWQEAKEHFEHLFEKPPFAENALIAVAEIYRLLGNSKEASLLYLSIADGLEDKDIKKHEDVLFHAALALKDTHSAKAIKIASHLAHFGLKKKKEAATLWFCLLAKEGRYEEMHFNEPLFLATLAEDKKGFYHFCLAKFYSLKKELQKVLFHLQESLKCPLASTQQKEALLMLGAACSELKDLPLLEKALLQFREKFDCDASFELLYARALKEAKEYKKAHLVLDNYLTQHPKALSLQIEKVKVLSEEKRFSEGRSYAKNLLENNSQNKELKRLCLNLSIETLAEDQSDAHLETLIADIEAVLNVKDLLTSEEHSRTRHLLASSLLSAKRYQKAAAVLDQLWAEGYAPEEMHFLLATAYFLEAKHLDKAIFHGEKALEIGAESFEKRKLHLHLFNAYLQLATSRPCLQYEEKAAQHLYTVIDEMPVSLENRLWLAHYFAEQCELAFDLEASSRAINILEPLFGEEGAEERFEKEALTLVALYQTVGLKKKQVELATRLNAINGRYKEECSLAYGDALVCLHEEEKAAHLYLQLQQAANPKVAYLAKLKAARLFFARGRLENKQQVQHHLALLKELRTYKNPEYEPLHLEAAIDYVEFSAMQCKAEERNEFLLKEFLVAKEHFVSQEDILSKDYHASLETLPEKGKLHTAYMRYLDARIYQLQARKARKEGKITEATTKEKAAFALFSSLRQGKFALTTYIKDKAAFAMK